MNIKTLLTDELFVATTQAELGQYHSREEVIAGRAIAKTKRVIAEWLGANGFELFVEALLEDKAFVLSLEDSQEFKKWGE